MTDSLTWRQKLAILRQVAAVVMRGGDVLRQVAIAAGVLPAPQEGAPPVSAHSALSAVIAAALQDKTWIQAAAMAAHADQFLKSGDLLVRVVRDHARVAQDDVRLGVEVAKLVAPRLAAELTAFLGGPLGPVAIGALQLALTGMLLGKPVQPKDPAYRLPEGPQGLDGISTGA